MIQHNTTRILDTINPNPKRAQQDKGRQRLVGQKTSYFQTKGQKASRSKDKADNTHDTHEARWTRRDDRKAERKRMRMN
jgi:hypothetical protein